MKRNIQNHILPATIGAALILFFTGCGRDNVKVYHVENNDSAASPPPATTMPATMPNGVPAPDKSGLPPLKYSLPDGWKEKPPTQMRVASFEISDGGKQADVSVIPMGGTAGGNLANVIRWRGQVGLGSVDEEAVQKMTEKVVIAGQDSDLFDIAGSGSDGSGAQRIIASVLHREDTAWFFKIIGDADLVEKNKPAFVSFLKSVQFGANAPATMDLSQLPPSHPAIPGMNAGNATTPAPAAGNPPTWTVPAGWQSAPLTQFLLAKFSIAGDGGAKAAVNVSSLTDDGGGLLANVNRWRQTQLGLDEVDQSGLGKLVSAFDANGSQASLVDFTGTDSKTGKPARLIGVVLPLVGQTWFYKLMGDPEIVAQQKDAFLKFIQSAKYPDAH